MALSHRLLRTVHFFTLVLLLLASAAVLGVSTYVLSQKKTLEIAANVLFIVSPTMSLSTAIIHCISLPPSEQHATSRNCITEKLRRVRRILILSTVVLWAVSIAADMCLNGALWNSKPEEVRLEQVRLGLSACALFAACVFSVMIACNCFSNSGMDRKRETAVPGILPLRMPSSHSSFSLLSAKPSQYSFAKSIPNEHRSASEISSICTPTTSNFLPHPGIQRGSSTYSLLPPIPNLPPLLSNSTPVLLPALNRRASASSSLSAIYPPEHTVWRQTPRHQVPTQSLVLSNRLALHSQSSRASIYSTGSKRPSSASTTAASRPYRTSHRTSANSSRTNSTSRSSRSSRSSSYTMTSTSTRTSTRSSTSGILRKNRLSIMTTVEEPPEHEDQHEHEHDSASAHIRPAQLPRPPHTGSAGHHSARPRCNGLVLNADDVPPVPRVPDLATLRPVRFSAPAPMPTAAAFVGGSSTWKWGGRESAQAKPTPLFAGRKRVKVGLVGVAGSRCVKRSSTKASKRASLVESVAGCVDGIRRGAEAVGSAGAGEGQVGRVELGLTLDGTAREFGVSVKRALLRV